MPRKKKRSSTRRRRKSKCVGLKRKTCGRKKNCRYTKHKLRKSHCKTTNYRKGWARWRRGRARRLR